MAAAPLLAGLALAAVPGPAAAPGPDPAAPTGSRAWIAHVVVPATARSAPAGRRLVARVPTVARWNGGPVGLLVREVRADATGRRWLRVALAQRPNGTTGWIPADHARLSMTRYRVEVATSTRRIRLLRDGRVVLRARAVVGAPATPTPTGTYAVSERVRQPDAGGFLGSWALHLTAFSDVLDTYGGGPGQVAIHGRGGASLADPLGSARSHGCIRVDNAVIARIAGAAREGTPVRIVRRFSHLSP